MSTHNIPFLNIKKKIILNYPKFATMGFVPRDPRTSFETTVVNEPSVFEPLKFCCNDFIKVHFIYNSGFPTKM